MTAATLQRSSDIPTCDVHGSLINVLLCYESDFEEPVSPFELQREARAPFSFGLHWRDYAPKHLALQALALQHLNSHLDLALICCTTPQA